MPDNDGNDAVGVDDSEYLPGLEPDDAEPEAEPPPETEASSADTAPEAPRYGPDGLTHHELNEWFLNEYFAGLEADHHGRERDGGVTELDAMRYSFLTPEAKSRFRDEIIWQSKPKPADDDPTEAGWETAADQLYVTLPDGSEVTVEFDRTTGRQRVVDSSGNAGEWRDIEVVPDHLLPPESTTPPPGSEVGAGFDGFKRIVIGGGIG